jgi:phosphoenolpyruvate carboxylase
MLRNPYVDPLSYLQLAALGRIRGGGSVDEREAWERVVRVAVQGIAAGLRHTG